MFINYAGNKKKLKVKWYWKKYAKMKKYDLSVYGEYQEDSSNMECMTSSIWEGICKFHKWGTSKLLAQSTYGRTRLKEVFEEKRYHRAKKNTVEKRYA